MTEKVTRYNALFWLALILSGELAFSFEIQRPRLSVVTSRFAIGASTGNDLNTLLENVQTTTPVIDQLSEIKYMMEADVSRGGNFYSSTRPNTKRYRKELDVEKRIHFDDNFYKLMNIGFDRRLVAEVSETPSDSSSASTIGRSLLKYAAAKTAYHYELGKSKDEQLQEIKKNKMANRSGIVKLLPQALHKFIDYAESLRIEPKKSELVRNLGLGSFISFVIWANMAARSSFMYFVIGNLAILSMLLTRGMPEVKIVPGMEKKKVASWSGNAFKTALGLTLFFTFSMALLSGLLTFFLPVSLGVKAKAAMIVSILGSSYFTSFYEVFEEKGKGGWRWKKAMEGDMSQDVKDRLANDMFGSGKMGDKYDYEYNPQLDDYPPLPKYLDEVQPKAKTMGGSNELDEQESIDHYANWRKERKEARRPPIEDAAPELPMVGSKAGMYVTKIPGWLQTAYNRNVLNANAWRSKPRRFIKDVSEFELIDGPIGFRDKMPEWLNLFGSGVWEEKTTVSRRAARAFGSYRKSMYRIDKKVQLLPCDGADKDPNAVKK